MPDLSGSAKENWGEKSISDENKCTPEVGPKSTNPHQKIKRRGGHICCIGDSPSPIFTGEGAENGNCGHTTCFNAQNTPIVTALKWFHASY